jgi:Eukaryotic protein of unknown function (DUF842)
MATPEGQAKAESLTARIQGEFRRVVDEIERDCLRNLARGTHVCAVQCYDKAGTMASSEALDNCTRNCQIPYREAENFVNQVCLNGGWEIFPVNNVVFKLQSVRQIFRFAICQSFLVSQYHRILSRSFFFVSMPRHGFKLV